MASPYQSNNRPLFSTPSRVSPADNLSRGYANPSNQPDPYDHSGKRERREAPATTSGFLCFSSVLHFMGVCVVGLVIAGGVAYGIVVAVTQPATTPVPVTTEEPSTPIPPLPPSTVGPPDITSGSDSSTLEFTTALELTSAESAVATTVTTVQTTTDRPTYAGETPEAPTKEPTTELTSESPSTEVPRTKAPTTRGPITGAQTTEATATEPATTEAETTEKPPPPTAATTTEQSTTDVLTSEALTTETEAETTVITTEEPTTIVTTPGPTPCESNPCEFGATCNETADGQDYVCVCNITCGCFTEENILDEECRPSGRLACQGGTDGATYPYDCGQYYDCAASRVNPPLESCPGDRVFSAQYDDCVQPYLAPCAGIDAQVCNTTCKCAIDYVDADCEPDCQLQGSNTYIPNPDDCQKYYICNNGNVGQSLTCPEGQVYDPDTDQCENAWEVPCSEPSPCDNSPCRYGAECTEIGDDYKCDCNFTCSCYNNESVVLQNCDVGLSKTCDTDISKESFSFPYDCTKYVDCADPINPSLRDCPPDFVYDPEVEACILASITPCAGGQACQVYCSCAIPFIDENCDPVCGSSSKIPFAGDCQKYWNCDGAGNVISLESCRDEIPVDNYVFDPEREACNFVDVVPCAQEMSDTANALFNTHK